MKLLLLKILLQRRARDEGFTLPMVIALGLVMLLLGAVNITTANEENLTAISQNSRSDALAIAEVGVARYRELLDRNRVLAINDLSQWGAIDQVCNINVDSLSSQTIADIQDLDNDGNTTEALGSYSLVSYDYSNTGTFNMTNDAANSNATGTLTVRGKAANDSGEAQIEVEIPIRINLEDMENLAPALWIGDNTVSAADLGNLTIGNGNVVIRDPAVRTGTTRNGCRNFSSLASTTPRRPVISDSRNLPPIDRVISDVTAARTAYSVTTGNPINTPVNLLSAGQVLFGATNHKAYNPATASTNCPNIKSCRYYYDNFATGTATDTDLLTDGVARTTVLLNQPLTITATGKNVKVGSTSDIVNDSNAFEIYVNGNHDIIVNANAGRTVTINGFIHAPQST